MPSANQVWTSAVSKARRPASRRPKSGTVTTQAVNQRVGGTNAVAGYAIANSTNPGRTRVGGRVL